MLNNIVWIFFDVGSTLLDESKAYHHRIEDAIAGTTISYDQFYNTMINFYKQSKKGDLETVKQYGLKLTDWHSDDEILYSTATSCLKSLSQRYKLGIVANQPLGTKNRLRVFGIIDYIDLVISSAKELSKTTGCLVAPTINYGVNLPCDRSFTGTTSISKDTLKNMITEIIDWWKYQGFQKFYIITFHGDPFHIEALSGISDNVYLIEPYEIDYTGILDMQSTMRHACEAETSIALYLYPEKVRTMSINESDIVFDEFREYLFHENYDKPNGYIGCLGYPKSATAKKGKILVEKMIERVINEYIYKI